MHLYTKLCPKNSLCTYSTYLCTMHILYVHISIRKMEYEHILVQTGAFFVYNNDLNVWAESLTFHFLFPLELSRLKNKHIRCWLHPEKSDFFTLKLLLKSEKFQYIANRHLKLAVLQPGRIQVCCGDDEAIFGVRIFIIARNSRKSWLEIKSEQSWTKRWETKVRDSFQDP